MSPSITSQYLARYRRLGTGDRTAELLPLTGAQRRFVLVRSLDSAGRPDLVPMFFAFPHGTVDPARLRAAACHLAALHPALRARHGVVRGTPVLRPAEPDIPLELLDCAPGEDLHPALRRALAGWAAEGPPLRLYLAQGGPATGEEVLAVVLDHAVCDGQSLARIVEELGTAYRDGRGPADVPPSAAAAELAAYHETVLLQLDAEHRAAAPDALAYWGQRLRAVSESTPLPRPESIPAGALPTGAAEATLPSPAGGAPFPALLDACRAAAGALFGAGTVSPVGYPWGGRPAGAPPVLGCFLNTVVFPAATGTAPFAPAATAEAWWDDLDRADTPFDEVVHAARSAGSPWSGRLDGMLTVDDVRRRPPLCLGGVEGREVHVDGRRIPAPFALAATQGPELRLRMAWDRAVLDDRSAEEAFAAFQGALRSPVPA
ncbi:non-ribosomal peptide synthetase [Streptoverticillium reticulum]|uniref:non-ribosomal peptide synthetase n=1 Tax=Streptoverticillium reticulum TaxID=1433415 RepID=UPI0039BED5E2